jgi:RNA polymerase sigma-70 factor (ECF subfamily)
LNVEAERMAVVSCQKGDKAAYADLVKAHSGRVFALCLGMLADRHEAEDMAQQALLKGFMEVRTLRDCERFGPWIARIARNLCVDALRKRRHPAIEPPVARDDERFDRDDRRRLEAALARLDRDYRVPLLLFYFDGRSAGSIAETLRLTPAAVQTRLSRARKQLRALLEAEGGEP